MSKNSSDQLLSRFGNDLKSAIRTLQSAILAGALVFALCTSASAQQPKKIPRIGFLVATNPSVTSARIEAFRQGLRALGSVEGTSIAIEFRFAEGKLARVSALAAELVSLNVDVIVTGGATDTRAAREETKTIPIVMAQDPDPVGNGFVANLARPRGNITGLSALAPELSGKRLELLREIIPGISRVAVFGTSTQPGNAQMLKEVELAANAFGVKLQPLDIRNPKDFENVFKAAVKGRAEAVLMLVAGGITSRHRKEIAELALKNRLPMISGGRGMVEVGGLMSYGVRTTDLDRRAAVYVDKILKGAKPADLPVEQPTKFELVINLKAAKQIGLAIPPNVLARADRVIK
jgi:putative ABC transport system substrate-binding protein